MSSPIELDPAVEAAARLLERLAVLELPEQDHQDVMKLVVLVMRIAGLIDGETQPRDPREKARA